MYISAWLSVIFLSIAVVSHIIAGSLKAKDHKTQIQHDVYVAFNNISYTADVFFFLTYVVFLFLIPSLNKAAVMSLVFFCVMVVMGIIGGVLYIVPLQKTIIEAYIFFGVVAICGIGFFASYITLIVQHSRGKIM